MPISISYLNIKSNIKNVIPIEFPKKKIQKPVPCNNLIKEVIKVTKG